jgi:hypothetical protein
VTCEMHCGIFAEPHVIISSVAGSMQPSPAKLLEPAINEGMRLLGASHLRFSNVLQITAYGLKQCATGCMTPHAIGAETLHGCCLCALAKAELPLD